MNAYNSARTLPRAIDSVLQQDFKDYELVVVDDGSTDDTPAVLELYRDVPRVRLFRQENSKCAAARQAGIAAARGKYVVFLDSDDEATPGWLGTFEEILRKTLADVVCAGVRIKLPRQRTSSKIPADLGPGLNNLRGLFLAGSFVVRRTVLLTVGGYVSGTEPVDHTDFLHRLVRHAESTPISVVTVPREVVIVHREEFVPYRATALLKGALHLLHSYPDHFQRDPRARSVHLGIAGVNAARLGDFAEARKYFREACAVTPRDIKCRARLWIAGIPVLAAILWQAPERAGLAKG